VLAWSIRSLVRAVLCARTTTTIAAAAPEGVGQHPLLCWCVKNHERSSFSSTEQLLRAGPTAWAGATSPLISMCSRAASEVGVTERKLLQQQLQQWQQHQKSVKNSSRIQTVAAVALLRAVALPMENCTSTAVCTEVDLSVICSCWCKPFKGVL
jgi:uncharacterized membrane protein